MLYALITRKRDEWLSRPDCPIRPLLAHITKEGKMRDAQVEAVKTYLFLKIACDNKPLYRIFSDGTLRIADRELSLERLNVPSREALHNNPAARTLYEYAALKGKNGDLLFPALKARLEGHAAEVDYESFYRKLFYGVEYPDYLFSLPMGAGKTFLMAAFIYLDLYFSRQEPGNAAFAHNFMILAPSGLKSSILPSIKRIHDFDPSWILPEPAASEIKKELKFVILDENKSDPKNNQTVNPNVRKLQNHYPLSTLRGLVAVTNAEKVILDRVDTDPEGLLSAKEREEYFVSNELRSVIGRIPHLSVLIDEVHHASDSDIKLRQVVTGWTKTAGKFNAVLGFSGTPYNARAEEVPVSEDFSVKNRHLANVVYHYPLLSAVGNFLKKPVIKTTAQAGGPDLIKRGVEDFLALYGHKVYPGGVLAKQAIYCSTIENLEENVYPLVSALLSERGFAPESSILKFHKGNKAYPAPQGAELDFASLDLPSSPYRIILLVQIGREGWDCRSLTSVVLPQEGATPRNMVLQTSCRCLREVTKGEKDTALIWLNGTNAKILDKELKAQQDTSIAEINRSSVETHLETVRRYSRMEKLRLPPLRYYQLKVEYLEEVTEEQADPAKRLASPDLTLGARSEELIVEERDLTGATTGIYASGYRDSAEEPVTFFGWVSLISKESLRTIPVPLLLGYEPALRKIFDTVTFQKKGEEFRRLSPAYDQVEVRSRIRSAFSPRRKLSVREEEIPETARLLKLEDFTETVTTEYPEKFFPGQNRVSDILMLDRGGSRLKAEIQTTVTTLRALPGAEEIIRRLLDDPANYDVIASDVEGRTYHYLPYRFDSSLERDFFSGDLSALNVIRDKGLEFYFNGDDTLTEFKINCFHRSQGGHWSPLGSYTPDFLILRRDAEGAIDRVLIIETKGEGYALSFARRKKFMQEEFVRLNRGRPGFPAFDFLYLEDTLSQNERRQKTLTAIDAFFA